MDNHKPISFSGSFSKSKFELISVNKKLFIKKKFINLKKRDFESILKNNFFYNNIKIKNTKVSFIKIGSFKDFKKKKYFIMNYINGYSGELIIKNFGYSEVNILKNFINDYFNYAKKNTEWKKLDKKIVLSKINQLKKKIKIPSLLKIFKSREKELLRELDKINFYPKGFCHGDLTLSNIIVDKKKVFLIDFLKTYNDGIAQDLSKIYQEFVLGWSSRKLNDVDILRSKLICRKIIDKDFFNSFSRDIKKVLKFEIQMTLFRIFPYVDKKDIKTINWIYKSLKKIKKKNIFINREIY